MTTTLNTARTTAQATAPTTTGRDVLGSSRASRATGLVLAVAVTVLTLAGVDHLAVEQHAGTVLAKAAAVQQASQAASAGQRG